MKRPTYLELGRRQAFGRPARKPVGPVAPPPDPQSVPDFDLGTWRVRPALGRMTRADRIVALEERTLAALLILAECRPGGINRDELAARLYGGGTAEDHEPKFRRVLGFLRRAFSEDGAVRIANAPGDVYVLEVGEPVAGRALKGSDSEPLKDEPPAISAWLARHKRHWLAISIAAAVVITLAGGLTWLIERGQPVVFGSITEVATLAAEPGDKTSPSFSPDGRQLVYSWRLADGSGTHLVLRGVAGGSWRPLTVGSGQDLYPAWSPTGRRIAFERLTGSDCAVYVIAPDGSDERRVGDCNFGAAGPLTWTRDGTALIYAHRTDPMLARQLVALAVDTGKLTGVTNPVVGMPGDMQPSLSTSGRRLVFVRSRAVGVGDLSLLELGGPAVERITRDGWPLGGAAFEAGNYSIVFASPRGGHQALWRLRLNGTAPELLYGSAHELAGPAVSADGRSLAFEEWRVTTRLVAIADNADTPATELRARGNALERQPDRSPDGKTLVFVSNRSGRDELWLAAVDGGPARALTKTEVDAIETPHWSADGRTIVFAGARKGRFELFAVTVAEGRLERIAMDGANRAPSFSRDGRWLYFASSRTGHWQVWRRSWPDGGTSEALTTEGGYAALESRDGEALYYVRPDRRGLWRRNREPGGDDTLVAPELSPADWRNLAISDSYVWFAARPDAGPVMLARYSLDNERVSTLRPLDGLLVSSGMLAAADGHSVIVAVTDASRADLKLATLK